MSSTQEVMIVGQSGTYSSSGATTFYMNPRVLSTSETVVLMKSVKMRSCSIPISVFANTFNNSFSVNLRSGGADVGSTITFATGETGTKVITHTSPIELGSDITLKFTIVATSGSVSFKPMVMHYD